jgi:hypothetical protein
LPIGRTLTLEQWFEHSGRFFTHARELRVEGFTTRLMLVNLSFIYLNVGLWRSALPLSSWQRPLEIALCLVPSLYIVPQHLPLRWVASWLQLAVHAWLIWNTREPLANACLAGTAVLFWRERFFAPRPEAAPDHQAIEAPLRLDAAGAIATVYAGLCALVFVAQLTHADQLASQSARLLQHAGLLPNYLIVGAR